MKINWGTGLVIGMVLFIGFIMTMVIMMSTSDKYVHELVTEDYYKKELELQDNIYAQQNGNRDQMHVNVLKDTSGLVLQFPERLANDKITGTVFLYRPSREFLDFEMPIKLQNSKMRVPENRLPQGRWDIEVKWSYAGTPYLHRKKITY